LRKVVIEPKEPCRTVWLVIVFSGGTSRMFAVDREIEIVIEPDEITFTFEGEGPRTFPRNKIRAIKVLIYERERAPCSGKCAHICVGEPKKKVIHIFP